MNGRWTPEREAILRELWSTGLSANAIADKLGDNLSRNAVIGKAGRLGLRQAKPLLTELRGSSPQHGQPIAIGNEAAARPVLTVRNLAQTKKARRIIARDARAEAARQARKQLPAKIAEKQASKQRRVQEEAAKLESARKRTAEARLAFNRRALTHPARTADANGTSARPPFEELRKRWFSALMYIHRFEHGAADAEDVLSAKRVLADIESEWRRLTNLPHGDPDYFEWPSTEARMGDGKIDAGGWESSGMLGYLGYHVGKTSALTDGQRRSILSYAFSAHLPPINSVAYMHGWGSSGSAHRLQKIAESLAAFTRLRKQRRNAVFQHAIRDWEEDLKFLYRRFYVGKFRFAWPAI